MTLVHRFLGSILTRRVQEVLLARWTVGQAPRRPSPVPQSKLLPSVV